jgi:hypothetical protein
MTHLDEGTLVAVRDGDPYAALPSAHVEECARCAEELEASRSRSRMIAEVLASLDEPVDGTAAKAAVRRRLDAERGDLLARGGWWRGHLGRAAALLVVTAGAASALPWSPVREWWAGSSAEPVPASGPTGALTTAQGSPEASISVAVPEGGIAVLVRGAEPGSLIEVAWGPDAVATVSAPHGSEFSYADGRVEVDATPGPVRVELPGSPGLASLEVGGRLFLARAGTRLDVQGPVDERTDAGIRFLVPAP